jgi:hypothetical protein
MLSPNDIDVILHYHTSGEKHPRADAPAVKDATERFFRAGLIEPGGLSPGVYFVTTEKGRKFIEMLCATPFPVKKFVDPREAA